MKKYIIPAVALLLVLLCVFMAFEKPKPVFETDNIKQITFYAYYGTGPGSEVPAEYMTEIVNWLDSFSVGEEVDGPLPPGTNTYYVEIEYSGGRTIRRGLDTVKIGLKTYYTKSCEAPECFWEILSEAKLSA